MKLLIQMLHLEVTIINSYNVFKLVTKDNDF